MFPSVNRESPLPTTSHTLSERPIKNDENPSLRIEDPPWFLHFPSPFLYENDLSHIILQPQLVVAAEREASSVATQKASDPTPSEALAKKENDATNRRRTGKRDRHSKICTAQGIRDRRMRLSVQIARKFFDLQDMLGFDKASTTIEWLFSKSKKAIQDLTKNLPQKKSTSKERGRKGKAASTKEGTSISEGREKNEALGGGLEGDSSEYISRIPRKTVTQPRARESRDKARARARERTREKLIIRSLDMSKNQQAEANPNNQFGYSSRHFEAGEKSSPTPYSLEHQLANVGIIESFLGTANASASFSLLEYQDNSNAVVSGSTTFSNNQFSGVLGIRDIYNAGINSNICAMTDIIQGSGNADEQNPSSIFMEASGFQLQSQYYKNQFPYKHHN